MVYCKIGCESGPGRRPMQLEWAIDLVRQCQATGVACFMKQIEVNGRVSHDPAKWPEELRVREFPRA
jgi:protein gp37